jgi:hypothetical protein
VHRSSESIGTIAAALAKAQAELTNPAKSLVATIRSPLPREGERTFRYAPLSSGLDIIRKALGRHEIATIQTTTIDKDAGLLRLTTVLAHSSGEWLSSEWPVCQIADVASAQRMGAALTYARRYALFTLVGIAGEDDLDAPDLGTMAKTEVGLPRADYQTQSDRNGGLVSRAPRGGSNSAASARPVLSPGESATVRKRLVAELSAINTADEAAVWAQRNLLSRTPSQQGKLSRSGFGLGSLPLAKVMSRMGRPLPIRSMVWSLTSRLMLSPIETSYLLAKRMRTPATKFPRCPKSNLAAG